MYFILIIATTITSFVFEIILGKHIHIKLYETQLFAHNYKHITTILHTEEMTSSYYLTLANTF